MAPWLRIGPMLRAGLIALPLFGGIGIAAGQAPPAPNQAPHAPNQAPPAPDDRAETPNSIPDQNAAQDQQIQDLQQQQAQAAPAPAAAAPASDEDAMAKLTQLKSLLDQGVLTQAEFDMQKQKILATM